MFGRQCFYKIVYRHRLLRSIDISGSDCGCLPGPEIGLVMELGWVNSGAPWWRRILTGLDPVDLIGWIEWI